MIGQFNLAIQRELLVLAAVRKKVRSNRLPLLALLAAMLATTAMPAASAAPAGEAIYRLGLLPSGAPLLGIREHSDPVLGAAAACINCHQRSGLGAIEGQTQIPPIDGNYLFRSRQSIVEDLSTPHVPDYVPRRGPYTETSVAQAIRTGVTPGGRVLSYLMPRYALDEESMGALIAYLKSLNAAPAPGVTADALQFATIITPDADPIAKSGMLAVLEHCIATQNKLVTGGAPPVQANRAISYRVARRWDLHVWELSGSADTWESQLRQKYAAEPVFAVLSGLGGRDWSPVHRFCESEGLPCLLPNVDLPVVAESDFYPVYFSRGVLLEADLIAHRLEELRAHGVRRVVQVFRAGDIGAAAAARLSAVLGVADIVSEARPLGTITMAALAGALADINGHDALVLWLRPAEIEALPAQPPNAALFVSGLMGGLEYTPLAAPWRRVARISFPVDLPEQRRERMNLPYGWFKLQGVAVVAERVQVDTFLACSIALETTGSMLDSFIRDFLIERLEMTASRRPANAYYPRLGLARGQRFASKGGYIVKFVGPTGPEVVAEGEWVVP